MNEDRGWQSSSGGLPLMQGTDLQKTALQPTVHALRDSAKAGHHR